MPAPPHATLDPQGGAAWAQLRAEGHRMLDEMLDYQEHIRDRPVWQPIPDATRAAIREPLPRRGQPLEAVYGDFKAHVLPYGTGNVHPGFLGWVHGGGTPVGMLAEMLAAGLNANLGGRDHMPIEIERQVTAWVRELFGFPDGASGLFVTGTSMANLIGLLVARTAALGPGARRTGSGAERLTAYTSTAAHVCIPQAMEIAGLGSDRLRRVPTDRDHRIDLGALERAIAADRAAGERPFLLVGTAGTVDTGAIDDLGALADVARRHGLAFHVDGAFGALGMLAPGVAPRLGGIERADSIAFDFHKWGQVPYDAGFVLVRDGALHRATFASEAAYLRPERGGLGAGSPWPCDYGPDLSRGFRALKAWFTLKVHGADALGEVIDRCCALAAGLGERVAATPELELLAPVGLNIVCFRHRAADEADSDRLQEAIAVALQEGGQVAPSLTTIGGRRALRAAVVNHRTSRHELDLLVDETLAHGRALGRRPPPAPLVTGR